MNKLEQLVRDCQRDLGIYLVPDSGVTDRQVINKLLSRLDGPQAREVFPLQPSGTRHWHCRIGRLRLKPGAKLVCEDPSPLD